jgi:hypothetical protein
MRTDRDLNPQAGSPTPAARVLAVLVGCLLMLCAHQSPAASPNDGSPVDVQWSGHLRTIGTATFIDRQSIYQFTDTGLYEDGQAELRLKNQIFLGSRWSLETHYEAVVAGGDTRANNSDLSRMFSGQFLNSYASSSVISDGRRFFNLTRILADEDDVVAYHRLDRLNLNYTPSWGSLHIGRQALTWGNGMVFNPMDLFNPFAPAAVQRDYKVGDDMLLAQVNLGRHEGQILYVPRRDPASKDLSDRQSSYAAKLHLNLGTLEADLMAARHFDDDILAWGATGYLGDAAWRLNAVYTMVSETYNQDDFFQVVANMDYAWLWGGKNVYGMLELFYNGLGDNDDYARSLASPYTADRLSRGDLFTLGNCYMAMLLQIELHPLVSNHWTVIANLQDPSGLVQPQLLWDAATNLQLILGAQWHWGAGGTEYGGFNTAVAGRTVKITPYDQVYLWLTYSF